MKNTDKWSEFKLNIHIALSELCSFIRPKTVILNRNIGILIACIVLFKCVGNSSVPVIYVLPDALTTYTVSTFAPEVEFPDDLPLQSDVVIRINGFDVTSEFNSWDGTIGKVDLAALTGAKINSVDTPNIWGALRDGPNSFQVSKPSKAVTYFTMDMPSAAIHIVTVEDGYDGCGSGTDGCNYGTLTFSGNVANGDTVRIGEDDGDGHGFTDYTFQTTLVDLPENILIGATAADSRDNLIAGMSKGVGGGVLYGQSDDGYGNSLASKDPRVKPFVGTSGVSMLVKAKKIGAVGSIAVSDTSGNLSWDSANLVQALVKNGEPIHVTGFLEGEGYATVSQLAVQISQVEVADGSLAALIGNGRQMTATPGNSVVQGAYSLTLNSDLSFEFYAYDNQIDADAITITVDDSEGSASSTWLRSNIPLYQTNLSNKGVLASRIDNVTIFSALYMLSGSLADNGLSLAGSNIPAPDDPDDMYIHVLEERIDGEVTIELNMPVPGENGALPGQLDISIFVESLYVDGDLQNVPLCDEATINTDVEIGVMSFVVVNPDGSNTTTTTLNTFDTPNLDIDLDGGFLCGIVNGLSGALAGGIIDSLSGEIENLIHALVNQVLNKDLPTLRLVFKGQYMSLAPELVHVTTSAAPWVASPASEDVAVDANFGFHMRGTGGRPNQSMGSAYKPYLLSGASKSVDDTAVNEQTVGIKITDNMVNQLLMGLWESGILYIDFNAGVLPSNPFVDDAVIQFASAAPWYADVLPSSDPKGDIIFTIPDLLIGFQADIWEPISQTKKYNDFNFLNLSVSVQIYADLETDKDKGELILKMASTPEFSIGSYSSEVLSFTETEVQQLADLAMNYVGEELAEISIALPDADPLTLNMGDVWSDDVSLSLTLDIYNLDVFPAGAGDPSGFFLDEFGDSGDNAAARDNEDGDVLDLAFTQAEFEWGNNWQFTETSNQSASVGDNNCPSNTSVANGGSGGNCFRVRRCDSVFSWNCNNKGAAYMTRNVDIHDTNLASRAVLSLDYNCNADACGSVWIQGRNEANTADIEVKAFDMVNSRDSSKTYNLYKLDYRYKTPGTLNLDYPLRVRVGYDSMAKKGGYLTVDDVRIDVYKPAP